MSERTLAPFGRRTAEVVANNEVGAYRLLGAVDAAGPAEPRPGQFYMLATESGWGGSLDARPYLPRAFSFCRAEPATGGSGAVLRFLLEDVGPGTERLGAVTAGERLALTGPLGIGFSPPARRPLLVGGGIGVAPLVCLHDDLASLGSPPAGEAHVLLGFRSAAHAAAAGLFRGTDPAPPPIVATDDGSVGRRALVTELLREELDRDPQRSVYACGPPAMLEGVRAICAEREVPAQLALESGMACGFGGCMGCVVPTRRGYVRLCVDGPVLDAAALESAAVPGAGH